MRQEHTDRPTAAEPGQGHGGQWPRPAPAAERKAEEKAEAIREKENLMGGGPESGEHPEYAAPEPESGEQPQYAGRPEPGEQPQYAGRPEPGEQPQYAGPGPATDATGVAPGGVPNTAHDAAHEPAPEQASTARADHADHADHPDGGTSSGWFEPTHTEEFRRRWDAIKASFVDDPREAVRRADELTDELMREVTKAMESRRRDLSEQWKNSGSDGDKAETERLRLALHNYRNILDPILRV